MYCIQLTSSFTRVRVSGLVVGKVYAWGHTRVERYSDEFQVDVLRVDCGRLPAILPLLVFWGGPYGFEAQALDQDSLVCS